MAKARRGRRRARTAAPSGAAIGREHWRGDGTAEDALRVVRRGQPLRAPVLLEDGVHLDAYVCGVCGAWHLGNRRD